MTQNRYRPALSPSGACPAAVDNLWLAVDDRTGPRTILGPGENCLLCDEHMQAGEVYLCVRFDTEHGDDPVRDDRRSGDRGIAHESCIDEYPATWLEA